MPPVDASGLPMPPIHADLDVQLAGPPPNAAGTKSRTRQKAVVRFPFQIHAGIPSNHTNRRSSRLMPNRPTRNSIGPGASSTAATTAITAPPAPSPRSRSA